MRIVAEDRDQLWAAHLLSSCRQYCEPDQHLIGGVKLTFGRSCLAIRLVSNAMLAARGHALTICRFFRPSRSQRPIPRFLDPYVCRRPTLLQSALTSTAVSV